MATLPSDTKATPAKKKQSKKKATPARKTTAKKTAAKKVSKKKVASKKKKVSTSTDVTKAVKADTTASKTDTNQSPPNEGPSSTSHSNPRDNYSDPGTNSSADHGNTPEPDALSAAMSQWSDYWFSATRKSIDMSLQSADVGMKLMSNATAPDANQDPLGISGMFAGAGKPMLLDPSVAFNANFKLLQKQAELWSYATEKAHGNTPEPVVDADPTDKRFKSDAWSEELVFDVLKQSYLLLSSWILDLMSNGTTEMDDKERARLIFMTRQIIDAMAPTNFPTTNPDVIAKTVDSQGENLSAGLSNLQRDFENGRLNIRQVNPDAFSVGREIAATKGSVVFENDLIQLIQYSPLTEKVNKVPLLIIPPWINKYYILDLKPENSFIRWAVEQGQTVFVISWRNVDSSMRETTFADYMSMGVLQSLDAIKQATGETSVNAIGYCIGGTLLASTLAWMSARNDKRIQSATLLTTQVDFSEPGELGHFIDEAQISAMEAIMQQPGYLDGAEMARTFNMLRSNDLIWSFWINNYLLGRDALNFDLLYWNADSTRIPERTHSFYLRQMYLENNLVKPGGITLAGEALDLTNINIPVYLQATRDDHIAPWRSVIKAKQHFSGDLRFVLAGSGHIAGVVNPPEKQKYSHWINEAEPVDPDKWDNGATEHQGSWWPDWVEWLAPMSGKLVAARAPGDGELKAIEPAPGRYVHE